MQNVYLGRQPILDGDGNLNSYEIMYSDGDEPAQGKSNRFLSASIISNVLNKFETKTILGDRRAFVKIDEKFLMNDLVFTIPNNFFIFSIVDMEMNERVIERFEQLNEKGYVLAINDILLNEKNLKKYSKVLYTLSYIKISFAKEIQDEEVIKKIVSALESNDIKVVATKVKDEKIYKLAKNLGCKLFQGYFFAKPKIFENQKYDSSQANILKLYTLLMDDTNIDEITLEFEKNHSITVQLLQYINSGAFHFRNKISSIHHILTLVGRTPLAQWLMLIIYSKSVSKNTKVSPLMLMVKYRTELMESIIKKLDPNIRSNTLGQAYFVGVLSLIDTVFGVELETILDDMHVDDIIKDALLNDSGILGDIYVVVRDIESFHVHGVSKFIKKHNLDKSIIDELALSSMQKVTIFENALK